MSKFHQAGRLSPCVRPFLFLGLAACAWADCPKELHAITGNIAADQLGPVDNRAGSAGTNADYAMVQIPFVNVPDGCRVQIVEIHGDFVAWPLGTPKAGTQAGVLVSLSRTSALNGGSKFAGLAADGYFLYLQHCTGGAPVRIPIDQKVIDGTLDADNVLQLKISEWMNSTGLKIHMEWTYSQIVFRYVEVVTQ